MTRVRHSVVGIPAWSITASLKHWDFPPWGHGLRMRFLASLDNRPCPAICFGQRNKWEWKCRGSLPARAFTLTPSHALATFWWRLCPSRALSDHCHSELSCWPCEGVRNKPLLCYITNILELFVIAAESNLSCPVQTLSFSQNFIPMLFYSSAYACCDFDLLTLVL